ncbi:MAG: N-acetylmuramoyl-L-alanine amidase [Rikenellaceae bacterium]|nr:N-acetylmuramoyl-L-alanine amidase [Rikenellaceae bacterium]MCL2692396.1 N-acetylmuramoyl-L-alanine amidase [Rikenellaceae bacterium]
MAVFLLLGGSAAAQQHAGLRTIVIDPGHGGRDPGSMHGNVYEKDIALAVSLMLGRMIREQMPEINVVYTRTTDVFVPLAQRGRIANDAKADLFISVHVNAVRGTAPSGALTLIMGREHEERNLDMAMKENDVIAFEEDYTTTYREYLSGSSEMFIIYSLTQYVNIEQSIVFANMVQNRFKTSTPMPDRGIRRQPLLVLWHTTMPGVLVELGFINNDHDRRLLTSERGQRQMATAIMEAVREYKERIDERIAAGFPPRVSQANETPVAVVPTPQAPPVTVGPPPAVSPAPPRATVGAPDVIYRVQILSALRRIASNSTEFKDYRGQTIERNDDGRYRYYVGERHTYGEAQELLEVVRRSFRDAFIVAFRGSTQITVSEARKLTE